MADIREKILAEYQIDLDQDNLKSAYKLKPTDEPGEALQRKLETQWRKLKNNKENEDDPSVKEKLQARWDNRHKHQEILQNPQLLHQVIQYYDHKKEDVRVPAWTEDFFALLQITKMIDDADVKFFRDYFDKKDGCPSQKRTKAYVKMKYPDRNRFDPKNEGAESEDQQVKKEKKQKSGIIEHRFSDKTVLAISACENYRKVAAEKEIVTKDFPKLSGALYDFLEIDSYKSAAEYKAYIEGQKSRANTLRQEAGSERNGDFISLQDLYTEIWNLLENHSDVINNFHEFKLLVRHLELVPYMFVLGKMNNASLEKLLEIACSKYPDDFRNMTDFLVNYFVPLYSHFELNADGIHKQIKNVQKQSEHQKRVNVIYDFIGVKPGRPIPAGLRLIYWLSYWPLILFSGVFHAIKFVIEKMRYIGAALGGAICLISIVTGSQMFKEMDFLTNCWHWGRYIRDVSGVEDLGFFTGLFASLEAILGMFFMYFALGIAVGYFIWAFATYLRKSVDLVGLSRTIIEILNSAKKRLIEQKKKYPNSLVARKMPLIISNVALVVLIFLICLG